MIVTVTANPAIDRLLALGEPLERGGVVRTEDSVDQPGGKGINVARVVAAAGAPVTAVFPAPEHDSLLRALESADVTLPHVAVPVAHRVRVNLTLAEPDGTTTKLNAPGAPLADDEVERLAEAVQDSARSATWVALCGSLPAGLPAHWYADLTRSLRERGALVAVDTSGAPLDAVLADPSSAPDLVKPNADELVDLLGTDLVTAAALEDDHALAAEYAQKLRVARGPRMVLLTLGSAGAVLATADGSWFAPAPRVRARSTVGAGDSSLAGFLLAWEAGLDAPACLEHAVRHGSAAAALPGSTPPTPQDVAAVDAVTAQPLA